MAQNRPEGGTSRVLDLTEKIAAVQQQFKELRVCLEEWCKPCKDVEKVLELTEKRVVKEIMDYDTTALDKVALWNKLYPWKYGG